MVELQILSKMLVDRSDSILTLNGITDEYFVTYPEEYSFIRDHVVRYGAVPDKETFIAKFPEFTILDVRESDQYLIDTFTEEYLYSLTVPVINRLAELMQSDSYAAVEFLQSQLPSLTAKNSVVGFDIISKAEVRLKEYYDRKTDRDVHFIPTGLKELDDILGGWQRGEELAVIFARTGQGKSWLLIKTLENAWKCGMRVGLIEPEMSANKTGYRFDTVSGHLSNRGMVHGGEVEGYESYIQGLQKIDTPFFVAHPREFRRKITISKLRSFVEANKLDILGIDGISYLTDERAQRGDNKTSMLTNISEDLMDLSIELKIPIIVVVQSNRGGVKDDTPDLENIRDSDGIAFNSSVVLAARQNDGRLELDVRKNRYGEMGDKLHYLWKIDSGEFTFEESTDEEDKEGVQPPRSYEGSDKDNYSSRGGRRGVKKEGTELF